LERKQKVSDYETTQRHRNITVGIFVLVAVGALVWLIYKFGDLPTKVSEWRSFQVFVQFPTAQGVQKDTPVQLGGYQIGRVTDVMAPERLRDLNTGLMYHQTKVVLSIDKKYVNIPSNVDIKVMRRGLGSSYIELTVDPARPLTPLDPNRPETKFLCHNMLLQGSAGMTSEFFPAESQKKLDELVDGLNALIRNANDIVGDEKNKDNFKTTLANMTEATQQATQALKEFREFSAAGAAALKNADARLERVVVAMVDTSEELSKTVSELRLILEKVNTGEGSAARLINDGRLYENLLENTNQMQMLLLELKMFTAEAREKGLPIKLK